MPASQYSHVCLFVVALLETIKCIRCCGPVVCCTCIIYICILVAPLSFPVVISLPFSMLTCISCAHNCIIPLFLLYTCIYGYVYAVVIIQYMIGSSESLVAYCHIGDPDVRLTSDRMMSDAPAVQPPEERAPPLVHTLVTAVSVKIPRFSQ